MNMSSETVAFLDVQVNHITKDVRHIIIRCFQKTGQRYEIFSKHSQTVKNFLFQHFPLHGLHLLVIGKMVQCLKRTARRLVAKTCRDIE